MNSDPPYHPDVRPDFRLDALTAYIYRHFSELLTEEERAAERVRVGRGKQTFSRGPGGGPTGSHALEFYRVPEVQAQFPELMRRIDELGIASVMRAAAERVLRDHPEKKILHTCPKCGSLCRTPKAEQCFTCGFDWHIT